jgi:hypothetical protein
VQAILGRRKSEGLSAYPQAVLGRFRHGCYLLTRNQEHGRHKRTDGTTMGLVHCLSYTAVPFAGVACE